MPVLGDEDQSFELRLSNKQTVEWIIMMKRQRPCRVGMPRGDIQWREATAMKRAEHVVAEGEFSGHALDRDFPHTCRADDDAVFRIGDGSSRPGGQARIIGVPPDEDMRIEQQIQVQGS